MIGGGFCGLAAAWELGRRGIRATVLERDAEIGGLAGSFIAGGTRLEKFYRHWFTNPDIARRGSFWLFGRNGAFCGAYSGRR